LSQFYEIQVPIYDNSFHGDEMLSVPLPMHFFSV